MDEKERLLYLTTKQFNLTEDEAKTLLLEGEDLKENAVDLLLEKDKERIQKLKDERTIRYNEGFQTAEKKFKSHSEDTFKKLTGYSGAEDNFEAMFTAWHKEETKKLAQKKEVTEDDIKRHPLFIDLETKTIAKEKYDELQKSFDQFKTESQRRAVMDTVTSNAWDVVAARNPILSENPTVAENRKRDFLAKFHQYEYELQDGRIIVLKEGKRLEDAHGNLKTFEAFTVELADQNFDFKAQTDKGNAGNKAGGNGGVVITDKPTTAREYATALDKWNGSSDEHAKMRIALKKFYHENKKD